MTAQRRAWNSTLPARSEPMGRGKGLQTKSAPRPGAALQARTPIRPVSAKRAASGSMARIGSGLHPFPAAVAALIDARDVDLLNGERCCQNCGSTEHLERHHRRFKGMGGSENRAHAQCCCNAVTLCWRCHRGCEGVHRDGRRAAEAQGFVVSQSVDEPGSVGVMRFAAAEGGATQWPSCDGRWLETAPEAGEEAA